MPLGRLSIQNLRNIKNINIEPDPSINLFYGDNGAGKTSLLEAINLLSVGRSFRHHRPKPLINYGSEEFVVHGELIDPDNRGISHKLGVSKNKQGNSFIKIDGEAIPSAGQLAEKLPVLNLNAQSFELINGPPKPRRQLLDWLAFHVEPLFLCGWKDLQICLKQRNSLLRRDKITAFELASWDSQLAELTKKIDSYRQRAFDLLEASLMSMGELLPDLGKLTLTYRKGWLKDQDYSEVLKHQFNSDREKGFTQSGPHRADLTLKINDVNAADSLSRGQQKVVISALVIAMGLAFKQARAKSCVFLIDDLPSELDETHRHRVGAWLVRVEAQLFVTAVDKEPLVKMWPKNKVKDASLFHVKQGEVWKE